MPQTDVRLVAHLMRRAGFGATKAELDGLADKPYEETVEDLLHPERFPDVDEDILHRYQTSLNAWETHTSWSAEWLYKMINSGRPLKHKMALFWHHLFATAWHKNEHVAAIALQIESFRRNCMTDMRTILLDLSRDAAMIDWLDNEENHNGYINENYGRELMELFSMGVGNYTEQDIKEAARAFTGWTYQQPIPLYPFGHFRADFIFREDDHDGGEKSFLGHTGRFDGEDIVDIIVRQPSTARFIARHLYNYFVADEPQVPAWPTVPPQDPDAIETLSQAYVESNGRIVPILRVLFNSDFFKEARYRRVKNPTELIVGTVKLTGSQTIPNPSMGDLVEASTAMGQLLLNPPTVEGWHTGREWIDGGTLNERVNFAVNEVGDPSKPGVREIISTVGDNGHGVTARELVDRCLDQLGYMAIEEETRATLIKHAEGTGTLKFDSPEQVEKSEAVISRTLQLIVSSTEYQFA